MRQFVSDSGLDGDGCIRVGGEKFHYLSSVLRLVPGDMLYVRLPSGHLQQMTVARVDGTARQILLSQAGQAPEDGSVRAAPLEEAGSLRFHLFQLVPKPPKMDLIIRQAAECGVSRIIPVAGEFCQKGNVESAVKKSAPGDGRWQKVITEALEQSGSPVQTEVLPCTAFAQALALWQSGELGGGPSAPDGQGSGRMAFVLYERSVKDGGTLPVHRAVAQAAAQLARTGQPGTGTGDTAQAAAALKSTAKNADIAVMVGAEGGISPSELAQAKEAGFIPVHLETNILRCETAALYGLAVIQDAVVESDIWKLKE